MNAEGSYNVALRAAWAHNQSHMLHALSLLCVITAIGVTVVPMAVGAALRKQGRCEANFRGDVIPQSFGLAIVFACTCLYIAVAFLIPEVAGIAFRWICAMCGFGALGYVDDRWGQKTTKGLKGHIRAALFQHEITTGFIKLVGGMIVALAITYPYASQDRSQSIRGVLNQSTPIGIFGSQIAPWLLDAAIVALSANAVNLLDLRPGRAAGITSAAGLALLCLLLDRGQLASALMLLLLLIPTIRVWRLDSRALVMLGDCGSNPLGAALGLAVIAVPSTPFHGAVLLALVSLHLVAERVSITKLIEANPVLQRIDRLTGIR